MKKGSTTLLFILVIITAVAVGAYVTAPDAGTSTQESGETITLVMHIGQEHRDGIAYYVYSGNLNQYGSDYIVSKFQYGTGLLYQLIIDNAGDTKYIYLFNEKWDIVSCNEYYIKLSRTK